MEQPVLEVNNEINRASGDPGSQGRFLTMVKKACLDFKSSPISYKSNQLEQKELLEINKDTLIKLQSQLG